MWAACENKSKVSLRRGSKLGTCLVTKCLPEHKSGTESWALVASLKAGPKPFTRLHCDPGQVTPTL